MSKIGRPRNTIKKIKTSIEVPENFQNTLYIAECKIPELRFASTSQKIVEVFEMLARGDLEITEQYKQRVSF
jgi:hypothetical protein